MMTNNEIIDLLRMSTQIHRTMMEQHGTFEQALTQFMAEPRHSNRTTTEPTPEPKSYKPKKPHDYDGSVATFDRFMRELRANFAADPKAFESVRGRIIFALSCMATGKAERWANRMEKRVFNGRFTVTTWEAFESLLKEHFDDPNEREHAQTKIGSLKQGKKSADEFFVEFEDLMDLAGYNDEAYIHLLCDNLDKEVVRAIYYQRAMPKTYAEWKEHAIQIDRHIKEFEKGAPGRNEAPRFPPRWMQDRRAEPRMERSVPGPANMEGPSGVPGGGGQVYGGPGQPMDIDRSRGASGRPVICYNCNKPGHLARNCKEPQKPRNAQRVREIVSKEDVRALMEELKLEGKDFVESAE